jgi:hypothetical protein
MTTDDQVTTSQAQPSTAHEEINLITASQTELIAAGFGWLIPADTAENRTKQRAAQARAIVKNRLTRWVTAREFDRLVELEMQQR